MLKMHIDAVEEQECSYDFQGARSWMEEVYDIIGFTVEQMKRRDFEGLALMEREVCVLSIQTHSRRKKDQARLYDKLRKLEGIRDGLSELAVSNLSELTEAQLMATI